MNTSRHIIVCIIEMYILCYSLFNQDAVDRAISWRPAWQLPEVYISGAEYDTFKSIWEKVRIVSKKILVGLLDKNLHLVFDF